jgi:hypothetical protein
MRQLALASIFGSALTATLFLLTGMQFTGASGPNHLDIKEFLSHVRMVDMDDGAGGSVRTVRIEELNVQIVNGLGSSEATNGAGNLVIGYDVPGGCCSNDAKTGSHNIVNGTASYTSYCGIGFGSYAVLRAPYASVLGGECNFATGRGSVVVSGKENGVGGYNSVILTGNQNQVTGGYSAVGAGFANHAAGGESWIGGGTSNHTGAAESVICGGFGECQGSCRLGVHLHAAASAGVLGSGLRATVSMGDQSLASPVQRSGRRFLAVA